MARMLGILVLVGAVFASVFGFAAALGPISGTSIAAGNAPVTSCDTDGVTLSYTTQLQVAGGTHFEVTDIVASNLDSACNGKYVLLSVQKAGNHIRFGSSGLNNCTFAALGGTDGQIAGGIATVDFNGPSNTCAGIAVADIDGVSVLIKDTAQ